MKRFAWSVLLSLALTFPAAAEESSEPVQPPADNPVFSSPKSMSNKLVRGSSNVLMGWSELPVAIDEVGNRHGVGAAATLGVLNGTGRVIQRTAFGIFEIITFPFSLTDGIQSPYEPAFKKTEKQPEPKP